LLAGTYRAKLPPEKQVEPVTKIVPYSPSVMVEMEMDLQRVVKEKILYASHDFPPACFG